MSTLSVATEVIKESWCKGAYKQELLDGETFCSMGALMQADVLINGVTWLEASIDRKASRILADTIIENYRHEFEDYIVENGIEMSPLENWNSGGLIVTFNDEIAGSHDEVVAMFEKATAKYEELV